MPETFPLPVPFGWFFVSYADELAPGEVKAIQYFGREWALFRTESGTPSLVQLQPTNLQIASMLAVVFVEVMQDKGISAWRIYSRRPSAMH